MYNYIYVLYPLYLQYYSSMNFSKILGKVFKYNFFSPNREATGAMTNLVFTFLKFAKTPNIFHFATHLKYSDPRTYLYLN